MTDDGGPVAHRAKVTLNVHGDDEPIPHLTRPLLDLWVHALHGGNPFLIVGRPGDDMWFTQVYRNGPGDFTLEFRDGPDAEVESTTVDSPGVVVERIWAWIERDEAVR